LSCAKTGVRLVALRNPNAAAMAMSLRM
jgi:hypothetical protein